MNLQTFKRYEDKFMMSGDTFRALVERLEEYMQLDSHCVDGTYRICNIYFDTDNNDVIRLSTSKPYYKEKLRLRSYGTPANESSEVFLELKKKIGGIVNKRRAVMTYSQALDYLSGSRPELFGYENRQVLSEIDWFFKNNPVKPAAYVSYDRIAMFGREDKSFRLTFDSNIQTRRKSLTLAEGSFGRQLLPPDTYLMEIKISGAIPLEIAHILSDLHLYSRSFSKIGTEYKSYLKGCYDFQEAI